MDENKDRSIDSIEKMKKRLLYGSGSRAVKQVRSNLHSVSYKAKKTWNSAAPLMNKGKKVFDHPSFFKRFFIWSVVFAVLALLIAGFIFLKGGNTVSSKNIDIAILGSSFVRGGEELPLQVQITNNNSVDLILADVIVEYPKNTISGQEGDANRIRTSVDTIPARGSVTEFFTPVLYGEQGSIRPVRVILEYRLEDSTSIFVTDRTFPVTISEAPVSLQFEGPTEIVSNQEAEFTIKVGLTSAVLAPNMAVRVEYPSGFRFSSSTPAPLMDNNVWSLGDITEGTEKTISFRGMIIGQDAEEKTFRIYVGEQSSRDPSEIGVVYNSLLHSIVLERPFIEAHLLINGSDTDTVGVDNDDTISGTIQWANNLTTRITDAEVRVKLSGSLLDRSSISSTNGFYDSNQDTLIWNRSTFQQFAVLEPGDTGTLSFVFKGVPLGSTLPTNPSIEAVVSISGSPAGGTTGNDVITTETKTIRFNSSFQLASSASYSTGPFSNTGSLPPKAEKQTTYTITWNLRNTINPLTGSEVRATLPLYVTWLGKSSPSSEQISYDASTREVIWKAGQINRGSGVLTGGREVSFQVGLTPSLSQVGSIPQLIGESVAVAIDSFTGVSLSTNRGALTTHLLNDPVFKPDDGRVMQ